MTTENTNPSVPANNAPQGGQPHGDEIDLVELAQKVWAKRKMILRNTAIGAVVGIVIAFSIPKEYKTTVKLAPESAQQSGMGGNMGALAAMAGINIGGAGADGLTPSLYPDIVASTPFLMELKDMQVTTFEDHHNYSLYEFMSKHQKKAWWSYLFTLPQSVASAVNFIFSEDQTVFENEWDMFHLNEKQQVFFNQLRSAIQVSDDRASGAILIEILMQDPIVSAQVADSVVRKLQSYMIDYRTEKARADLKYSQSIFLEAKQRYFLAQNAFAQYEDANKNVISASYALEKARLQNDLTLSFSIYNTLAQQLEMAKAKVQQDTPVLTVFQPAIVPYKAFKPSKIIVVLSCLFISLFLSLLVRVIYVFYK